MMKGLRISSLLQFTLTAGELVVGEVLEIREKSVLIGREGLRHEVQIDKVAQIKISGEWLERLGFRMNEGFAYELNLAPGLDLRLINQSEPVLVQWAGVERHTSIWLPSRVEYVHEMQNLYQSLTGRELKLVESKHADN